MIDEIAVFIGITGGGAGIRETETGEVLQACGEWDVFGLCGLQPVRALQAG